MRGKWLSGSDGSVKKVELWVNGVRRYQKTWTSNYPDMYPDGEVCQSWLATPYSTTQFSNGTTLTFKAKLWTTNDNYYEGTDPRTHYAWNRAWVGACPEYDNWVTRAGYARSFFLGANHTTTTVHTSKTAAQIESAIPHYSGFHITGHGTGDGFADCLYRSGQEYPDEREVDHTEICAAVAAKSSTECQYNFVFLDTCASGTTDLLKSAFGTQSFLGWDGLMWPSEPYRVFVQTFYSSLGNQGTVGSSALDAYNASGLDHFAAWGGTYYVHRTY